MQKEIKDWINANGGQSYIYPKIAIRVDKQKIKFLLENNQTINQISCN